MAATQQQPKITNAKSVAKYAEQVMQMRAMLANLTEFLDSMPAPDENEYVPGLDYGHLGSLDEMHKHILIASETSDEMFD